MLIITNCCIGFQQHRLSTWGRHQLYSSSLEQDTSKHPLGTPPRKSRTNNGGDGGSRSRGVPAKRRSILILQNPKMLRKVFVERTRDSTPKTAQRSKNESNGGINAAPDPLEKGDRAPRKSPKNKREKFPEKKQRVSLRIQSSGRKSRAAENSMKRRGTLKKKDRSLEKRGKEERALERRTIRLPDSLLTVGQLSEILDEKPASVIKFLITDLGIMASISQTLDRSTCITVVQGFGKIVSDDSEEDDDEEDNESSALELGVALLEDDPEDLEPRAPVVTIMGHVDHGKTSLLDSIRQTRVTASESGGITQHIAAYQVMDGKITFIDTPGHAAFSEMRSRGANMTDIVVLVVAADDSIKQQTVDSIVCARQAGVPILVAINKCDLETADVTRVKSDLAGYDVLVEDLGGEVLCSEISAKLGTNIEDLLAKIVLQSELQNLKANPNREAQALIIEARIEKGLGIVATALIQHGTLKIGDTFVAGGTSGRVRALITDDGKTRVKEAGPSTPVSIVGFTDSLPDVGDLLLVTNEQNARELASSRIRIAREKESISYQTNLKQSIATAFASQREVREMCIVVKADVQGSAEALKNALSQLTLENEEVIVKIKVLVAEAGDVSKTDIAIADVTPETIVIAFDCAANYAAQEDARALQIPIEYYNVIYDAIDSVQSRMQEVLSPTPAGEYIGKALVQEVFDIGGTGNIAGSKCIDGYIRKGSNIRILRGDKILIESKIRTLRNFKSEVDQIDAGAECGIGLLEYQDFQPGDVIESYVEK